jgi:hypothetical protein
VASLHQIARQRPDTTRIRVKGVPLSADDGQIRRTLEVMIKVRDGEILHMYREQLRVGFCYLDTTKNVLVL